MKFLSIFCLLSSIVLVSSSRCRRDKPRREGFLRKPCVPGFFEGSCLLILEKQSLHGAIETCRYDYGGRLATAPKKEAINLWGRIIHFNTKEKFNDNAKFWIGYGTQGSGDLGFIYEEPNNVMQKYINKTMWRRVFGKPLISAEIQWERNARKNSLDNSDCPNYGVVFNPKTRKFDVKDFDEEHYSLCETPRWAKLQCSKDWHLIPQLRMCLKVHGMDNTYATFFKAYDVCHQEKSFIAVPQNGEEELEMFRDVIIPYNLQNELSRDDNGVNHAGFWVWLKSWGQTTFAIDGSHSTIIVDTSPDSQENNCQAMFYETAFNQRDNNGGVTDYIALSTRCTSYDLPYMCQRFADQSLTKNLQ
uniref:C-type lectin domain-containing protein n=1 Tax=Panagrolaimus davidi TaxID=227884 RepID=A0A914QSW4_9BILA